ncbi:MAG: tRNA guanosine(15) transglycosylase TgtA [Nitrososphaerota archaeon]|nr:tRNA guanosine(15) transglycosylase TgtA [Nitrososphaerota archaeon]
MEFTFEVKETDLLGRVGELRVGGKTLETPYMFPVIHPVNQQIPTQELTSMGYAGLMTNSYIIYSRRRQEALEKGIHSLLGYDGVFITDSGGYQVLEYGDLEIGYKDVAEFQARIGSELAVTLDRPTGYPQKRPVAKASVDYSFKNAKATLDEFGEEKTTWVGPIQGGLYLDLVRRSAKSLVAAGFEFLALGSPVQVMQNYMYSDLVDMIVAARRAIPYSVPLHLFGAGHPLTMPLAVALGCDTFDSASYVLFARSGRYMTRSGVLTLKSMKYLPCSCPACAATSVTELSEMGHQERTRVLSLHNLSVLREEIESCKEAVSEGRLWDLVEERSMAHPKLRDAFARMAEYSRDLEVGTPALKDRGLFVRSDLDRARPELAIAKSNLAGATSKRSKAARVVAGPSGSREKADEDLYGVHPVLGAYPIELQFQYPFSQTETSLAQAAPPDPKRQLKALGYATVKKRAGEGKPVRSRRTRRGASPSLRSSSARSR